MKNNELKRLLSEYHAGTIQKSDLIKLLDYVGIHDNSIQIDQLLAEIMEEMGSNFIIQIDAERLYDNIVSDSRFKRNNVGTFRKYFSSIAAAILLIIGGIWWYNNKRNDDFVLNNHHPIVFTKTKNPSHKLLLKTSSGRIINLDDSTNINLNQLSNINTLNKESLVYGQKATANEMHTIITPKGRHYSIQLPDGTKVWLNSATTITFPTKFKADKREVILNGEAYFEVEKAASWPFVVKSNHQYVSVLGTHFNVSSYYEDNITYTSLLEGKVKVSNASKQVTLYPGQVVKSTTNSNLLEIKNVDVKNVIAWKDDIFVFNSESIQEVMRKISRCYDIEVVYLNGMEGKKIGGSIARTEDISELMNALQSTGLFHYEKKGGQIIIKE